MIYGCGQEVMEGDTVERVGESLSLTIGDWYTVYIPSMSYGKISVKEISGTMTYCPSFFKLIKRKEKEMNKRLERNQEYDVKLTGEEIAFLRIALGNMDNISSFPYNEIYEKLGQFVSKDKIYCVPSISITHCSSEIRSAVEDILKPVETEDQRKLRELKEQYAKLGDSIAAMEKK